MLSNIERSQNFQNHQLTTFFHDEETGLKGFFAIHNTTRGPAIGGTRYYAYGSESAALDDVLSLSRAMTYKCALANVPHGGGKGVILADAARPKSASLLKEYARRVNLLGGNFITGEDVGFTAGDVAVLAEHSPYIVGHADKGRSPGIWAGLGVFFAITAALEEVFGSPRVKGRTFSIKGLGKVGRTLCLLLSRRGGTVVVADVNPIAIEETRKLCPNIKAVEPDQIGSVVADVYAPCALGGEFTRPAVEQLRCKIVCGGANNQLSSANIDQLLFEKGILYIPDYVANAGGLIRVADELHSEGPSEPRVRKNVENIHQTVSRIIQSSRNEQRPMTSIANALAEDIFMSRTPIAG